MDRNDVESSNIISIGYDETTSILEVEFKSGGVYQYKNVPEDHYTTLLRAESVGRYFHNFIKGEYDFEKVEAPETVQPTKDTNVIVENKFDSMMEQEKVLELKSLTDALAEQNDLLKTSLDIVQSEIDRLLEAHKEQYKPNFEMQKQLTEKINKCKEIIRKESNLGFKEDGIKSRFGGIGIRVMKTFDYDSKEALKFAKEKDLFLQLDKKSFEKVAKTGELDFVNIGEKVIVTFPKEIKFEDENECKN